MKQIRASKLRQKAVTNAKLFSQTRSAHHQHVVKEARLKANVTQLQQQMQSEKAKNNLQANTVGPNYLLIKKINNFFIVRLI